MHYIIGTEILINEFTQAGGSGLQPVNAKRVVKRARNQYFRPGVQYTLYNISQLADKSFKYSFTTDTGDLHEIAFESIAAAELVISEAKKEATPDYTDFYDRRSD
jgi:hypothetical protein